MEELGKRSGKESRDCDKGRTDATPAARWRHSEHPLGMDAAGKLTTDSDLCPDDFMLLAHSSTTEGASSPQNFTLPLFKMIRSGNENNSSRDQLGCRSRNTCSVRLVHPELRSHPVHTLCVGTHVFACLIAMMYIGHVCSDA